MVGPYIQKISAPITRYSFKDRNRYQNEEVAKDDQKLLFYFSPVSIFYVN